MRPRFILLLVPVLFLAACQTASQNVTLTDSSASSVSPEAAPTVSVPDMAVWQTYAKPDFHFSIKYPSNWEIHDSTRPEKSRGIIAWVYDPLEAGHLAKCQGDNLPSRWQLECGREYADAAMQLFDAGYVSYDTLSDWEKQNYPQYQTLQIGTLDAFEYAGRTDPPSHVFHVNHPDKKHGIDLILWSPDTGHLSIARRMLDTFRFAL